MTRGPFFLPRVKSYPEPTSTAFAIIACFVPCKLILSADRAGAPGPADNQRTCWCLYSSLRHPRNAVGSQACKLSTGDLTWPTSNTFRKASLCPRADVFILSVIACIVRAQLRITRRKQYEPLVPTYFQMTCTVPPGRSRSNPGLIYNQPDCWKSEASAYNASGRIM